MQSGAGSPRKYRKIDLHSGEVSEKRLIERAPVIRGMGSFGYRGSRRILPMCGKPV